MARRLLTPTAPCNDSTDTGCHGRCKASFHSLRHTFASNFLEEGAEIVSIKELMGHSSIESRERYAKLSNQRVKHVYLQTIKKVIDKTRV
jgi:site-specific recombinase XerD